MPLFIAVWCCLLNFKLFQKSLKVVWQKNIFIIVRAKNIIYVPLLIVAYVVNQDIVEYRQIPNIPRIKSQNLNVSRLAL